MNYCDVDKDGTSSKTELNEVSNSMQNMKRIDQENTSIIAKLFNKIPLNTTIKFIPLLTRGDSVASNELRIVIQSITTDLIKQLEEWPMHQHNNG